MKGAVETKGSPTTLTKNPEPVVPEAPAVPEVPTPPQGGAPSPPPAPSATENAPSADNPAPTPEAKTHGNTLNDNPAEGYTLRDRDSTEVKKYGETTRGDDKFGSGKQKRYTKKYLKENNLYYKKEVSGTKKEMHQWQTQKIKEHKAQNNGKRPDLNKSDY